MSKTVTRSDGTKTVNSTYTNPTTGKSVTSDQTYAKTSNGWTETGTVTGPNGGVSTDNKTVSFTNNSNGTVTRTATGTVTGPNGNVKQTGNSETWTKTFTPASTTTTN